MRWEALQRRLEAVQQRRRDRERETSRRMQAANRHTQARERRKVKIEERRLGWIGVRVLSSLITQRRGGSADLTSWLGSAKQLDFHVRMDDRALRNPVLSPNKREIAVDTMDFEATDENTEHRSPRSAPNLILFVFCSRLISIIRSLLGDAASPGEGDRTGNGDRQGQGRRNGGVGRQ